jgi:hypothetical protein
MGNQKVYFSVSLNHRIFFNVINRNLRQKESLVDIYRDFFKKEKIVI